MKIEEIMFKHFNEDKLYKRVNLNTDIMRVELSVTDENNKYLDVINNKNERIGRVEVELIQYLRKKSSFFNIQEIIDGMDDGFVAIDEDGRIFMVNRAYFEILGIDKRILGKYMNKVETNADILRVLETKKPMNTEKKLIKSVNKYVSTKIQPILRDGEVKGAFSIFKDVTELNSLNKEVKSVRKVLEHYTPQIEAIKAIEKFKVIGQAKNYVELVRKALVVAKTDATVLIRGESGVGKEIFAKIIHNNSGRKNKPLITVNCAAIPENLIESELFGYEEGAFTGAQKGGKVGKFQLADGGTLFLDEIGDMPLAMQAKLLRVLQDGEIEKIGRKVNIPVDVRIVAATNQSLESMIDNKIFRQDLYYRLNVVSFEVPSLKERGNDVILLANYFLDKFNYKYKKNVLISQETYDFLLKYDWPGNVRELQNCIEYGVIMCKDEMKLNNLPINVKKNIIGNSKLKNYKEHKYGSLKEELKSFEKRVLLKVLEENGGNKIKTMEILDVNRRTFYRKLKEYDIN